jgi:hypothetical protein
MTNNIEKFNKIESFVNEQVKTAISLIITETKKGYKVNDFSIHKKDDAWAVINAKGNEIANTYSQRLAILTAALTCKKKYSNLIAVYGLDFQLRNLKHDKRLFEHQMKHSNRREVLENRLSRVVDDLSNVYQLITELEKSVGLQ